MPLSNSAFVIAIDGPAAAGKGTLARLLADHYDFAFLDTGALYRAVGLQMLIEGSDLDDAEKATETAGRLDLGLIGDPRLRAEETGGAASRVAAVPGVRAALLDFQRRFAGHPPAGQPGAVLDGRDIGTVVCPDAPVKLFVTASAEERARRRTLEMEGRGEAADYAAILEDVKARDARDMGRKDAPLRAAEDALLLDTTNLAIDAVFLRAKSFIDGKLSSRDGA